MFRELYEIKSVRVMGGVMPDHIVGMFKIKVVSDLLKRQVTNNIESRMRTKRKARKENVKKEGNVFF